jgi:arylsulfatase A-like enzyme
MRWSVSMEGQRTGLETKPNRIRMVRVEPDHPEREPGPSRPLRIRDVIVIGIWFGAAAGLIETAVLFSRKYLINPATLGVLQMNPHAVWVISVANLLIFTALAAALGLLVPLNRRIVPRIAIFAFATLACFEVLLTFRGLSMVAYGVLSAGLGVQISRRIARRRDRFQRFARLSLPAMIVVIVGLIGFKYGSDRHAESAQIAGLPKLGKATPNVLLIVLDTVRAKNLSLYGYHRPTTPNLERLARRGVVFDQARSPGVWTLPSHCSLFTGRWPHELSARAETPLDDTFPTLAEFLTGRGYMTAGFVANTLFCNHWYGVARGFIHYRDVAQDVSAIVRGSGVGRRLHKLIGNPLQERPSAYFYRKNAATINDEFLSWIDGRGPAESAHPFFVFLNYYDAHDPYMPPGGFHGRFGMKPPTPTDVALLHKWHELESKPKTPEQVQLAVDAYDECIASLDEQLGRLFESLERRDLIDKTMIVVTADHGEEFGEHGGFGHGNLYPPVTHVPLLIVPPGGLESARRVARATSIRDVAATIADVLNLDSGSPFPGTSLALHWDESPGKEPAAEEVVLTEVVDNVKNDAHGTKYARSLIIDGKAYLKHRDGREELFDLANDPAQTRDLSKLAGSGLLMERFRACLAGYPQADDAGVGRARSAIE